MQAAAPINSSDLTGPNEYAVRARHTPAAIANTTLANEITLGVTPARVSNRAKAFAHARSRVFSGRLGAAVVGPVLILLVETEELCYLVFLAAFPNW